MSKHELLLLQQNFSVCELCGGEVCFLLASRASIFVEDLETQYDHKASAFER